MYDALSIINKGLGKIAASRISSIAPPKQPLERHCAEGYEHWVRSELQKRQWRFATEYAVLTQEGPAIDVPGDGRRYAFPLPTNSLAPIRAKASEWEQRGRSLYNPTSTLTIEHVIRVPEAQFDPAFVEVLACRVALECVEYATQSNTKIEAASAFYKEAVNEAYRSNAAVLGPRNLTTRDEDDTWVMARYTGEVW